MPRRAAARFRFHPDYIVGRDGDDLLLTNYANGSYRYPDPQPDAAGCESA